MVFSKYVFTKYKKKKKHILSVSVWFSPFAAANYGIQ